MRLLFLSLATSLLLAACAGGSVSRTPQIDRAELAAEQQEQEAIVKQSSKKQTAGKAIDRPAMLARLDQVGASIAKAGRTICADLRGGQSACEFPFALDKNTATEVNAYTDGSKVVVSPAMMDFAEADDELAVVLAHEYAHAIMTHPAKTQQNVAVGGLLGMAADMLAQTQGINTGGTFGKLGTQTSLLRYSQDFEREADYIGMYVLARAGHPVAEAARFWRRMATVNPEGIYNSSTHPTTAERYILLKKTAAEIKQKQTAGQPLLPERLPEE